LVTITTKKASKNIFIQAGGNNTSAWLNTGTLDLTTDKSEWTFIAAATDLSLGTWENHGAITAEAYTFLIGRATAISENHGLIHMAGETRLHLEYIDPVLIN
jgi:hypothetical protein